MKKGKADKIIDVALELLKNEGDHGVTMRRVASLMGISLSNVQYYYKNKDVLLTAIADRYFQSCLEDIKAIEPLQSKETLDKDLERLLRKFLSHGLEVTEMCRLFREYWAISTRNEVIDRHIKQYYTEMAALLSEKLKFVANSEMGVSKAVTIIIPYVEGYSITALTLPEDFDNTVTMLVSIISSFLRTSNSDLNEVQL